MKLKTEPMTEEEKKEMQEQMNPEVEWNDDNKKYKK